MGSVFAFESRIERALVWFQRVVLCFLVVGLLLRGEIGRALTLAGILAVHAAIYLVDSRLRPRLPRRLARWLPRGLTLADLGLGAAAYYSSGTLGSQGALLGFFLGFVLAGTVAARLGMWAALATNAVVCALFSLPFVLARDATFGDWAPLVAGTLVAYAILTPVINYLVAMEVRQARLADDAEVRLRRLSTVHELSRTITSTLDLETVLNLVVTKAMEIMAAEAGSLLLLEELPRSPLAETGLSEPADGWESVRGDLVFRVAQGPAAQALIGKRLPASAGIAGVVLTSGQGQYVNDVRADRRWNAAPDVVTGFETASLLCVPLLSRGRPFGVLEIVNKGGGAGPGAGDGRFDDDDLELLSTFASQAGIALENARLYEKTDETLNRRLRELATIEEVDHELGISLDYQRIIRLVLERALEVCNGTRGSLGIVSADRRRLIVSYWSGQEPEIASRTAGMDATDWPIERGIAGRVARTGQSTLVPDIKSDPDYHPVASGTQSEVAVPIKREDRVVGVLNLESDRLAAFSEDHLHFLEHLADHAGQAIENARRFDEERQRVQVLSAVSKIGREISSSLDLERTLNLILAHVRSVVTYYIAEVCLWEESQQVMITWASAGDARYTARTGGIYHLNEGYTGWITRNRQELLVPDTSARADVHPKVLAEDAPIRAYVGVPLKIGETLLGTLELASDCAGAYGEDTLQILRIVADQAAVAIQNARLYADAQRRYEQTRLLLEVTDSLSSTLDLTEAVRRIGREMCRALRADYAGVYLTSEDGAELRPVAGYHVPPDRLKPYRSMPIPVHDHPFLQEAFRTLQPVYSMNLAGDPSIHPVLRAAFPHQTLLLTPMVVRDEALGGVWLVWKEERKEPTADELQLANAMARQAGALIENARLFDAQQRRLHEMEVLFETSAAISSSLDMTEVLRTVARQMTRAIGASSCSISDWDPGNQRLGTLIDESVLDEPTDVGDSYEAKDYPATRSVLQSRQPCAIRVLDPQADPAERDLLEKLGKKAVLMLPLVSHDRVVGLVELYESRQEREFTANEIRLCQALANQAAVAIENARLYSLTDKRLQARVEELTALQRTAQQLNATLDQDSIMQVVLESAVHTTGATHGNVMLRDLESGLLTLHVAQGYTDEELAVISRRLPDMNPHTISYQVVQSGQARIVADASLEPTVVCVRPDTRSAMVVPIPYAGTVLGLINLRHTRIGAFDEQDLKFVQALAEQAAVAIGNALSYEDEVRANSALTRRTEQMDSLLVISQKLRADVPLAEVLEDIAYAIQDTVGFNLVVVNLVSDRLRAVPVLEPVAAAGLPVDAYEDLKRVIVPAERYERIMCEDYRQGPCYFFPHQKREDWAAEIHTVETMDRTVSWEEGQWHSADMLLVPMRSTTGELLGVISVDEPLNGLRPSPQTLQALAIFGNHAALAVENAALYADVRQRAESLALLNTVGRTLTQAMEPAQVMTAAVRATAQLLHCEQSAIFVLDARDGKYAAAASHGAKLSDIAGLRFAPGEGLVGAVAQAGDPMLIPNTELAPRFVTAEPLVGSMLLAPMMVGKRVVGVLTAGATEKYRLGPAEQVLLTTLADRVTLALEGARLFESTQQAAVRLSYLNEIGRQSAAQLELQEMLETAVNALHKNLGYYRVAVLLLDRPGTEVSGEGSGDGEPVPELYVAAANEEFWSVIPPGYRQKVGRGLIGTAAASGQTVLCNDTTADERYFKLGGWDSPSTLSVPIQVAGESMGVLEVESDQPRTFSNEDAAALEVAADQLAVSIQNARLFQETQRRVAELATINEVSQAISGTLDPEQLYELLYTQLGQLLDTRNLTIALYDAATETIRFDFQMEHGQRTEAVHLQLGQGLTSHVIRTGQPLFLPRGSQDFRREHGLELEGAPARSWLGVPMIAKDRVIGAITLQSYDRENAFDQGHLNLLETLAAQAAIAFQNVGLFQERERRIAELAVLNEMSRTINSALDLETLLVTVEEQVSRLFDTTNFYVATYEEGDDEWVLAYDKEHGQRQAPLRFSIDVGLTGCIIRERRPILFLDADQHRAFHEQRGMQVLGEDPKSWMGVPLIAANQVVGVMAIQSYEQEHAYTQQDLTLFSTISAQAAVAIRNAQLYWEIVQLSGELEKMVDARTQDLERALGELTRERDRAETLYRITSELGTTLDLERVLDRALRLFADALGVEHGTIMLLDQETGYLTLKATLDRERELPRDGHRTAYRKGVGMAGWVLQHNQAVLAPDVKEDPRWLRLPDKDSLFRSVVVAPLSLGGDVLGILTLGHPSVGYFTQEHMQVVTAAAAQVAVAVNNSDLYAYITEQADQLGVMLQTQRAEAAKSRAILESIADGVLVLDTNGRVLLINPAVEELLGLSAMVLQGEHFRHMLGLSETAPQRELAQALYYELRRKLEIDDERGELQPTRVRLEAGKRVLVVSMSPLIAGVGGAPGLVAVVRDMSREAEVERLKNEFISTVSHELRTPMTSIKGFTDLLFLGMAGGLTDTQRNFLQIIKSNVDRLTALVNDILDISRIETGRVRLTIEPLALGPIVTQVVTSFQTQFQDRNMGLTWEEPAGLPEVRADAARVTQVLTNLIANARNYTPAGGQVTVTVGPSTAAEGFLQVDVADTGIGIAPENLTRIFDRFYRVDHPMVQEATGSGLGLSIVKMFVEMLGGRIWVDSQLGVGSTFHFTLPMASAEVSATELVEEPMAVEMPLGVTRRSKILVVEDDRDLALLLRRQLETEGYNVLLAGSGQDALWLAQEEQPQLITLDIMLPDMDGFLVLEQLKDHPVTAPIPVVIVSILNEAERGYSLGAVDYVVKPFGEAQLLQSIRHALNKVSEGAGTTGRLLVVDDEPDVVTLLVEALGAHGYEVMTATNGWEAVEQAVTLVPDLVLLDLKMPGMDGYEVIRQLKADERTRPIPIIVMTASVVDKERDKVRVLGLGATEYMTKPLAIESLVAEIRHLIAERQPE